MTVIDHKTEGELRIEARKRKVRRHLDQIDENRTVWNANIAGLNQRQIADIVCLSQPQVHRMLRLLTEDVLAVTPEEIIFRALVNDTDPEVLFETLSKIEYTFGENAPYPFEGRTTGTWDQVEGAYASNFLDREIFYRVKEAVGA